MWFINKKIQKKRNQLTSDDFIDNIIGKILDSIEAGCEIVKTTHGNKNLQNLLSDKYFVRANIESDTSFYVREWLITPKNKKDKPLGMYFVALGSWQEGRSSFNFGGTFYMIILFYDEVYIPLKKVEGSNLHKLYTEILLNIKNKELENSYITVSKKEYENFKQWLESENEKRND
jgi:hypothetical protein